MRGDAVEHERASCTTRVRFTPLSDAEIAWYVATGEADGKAGAYAIQGRASRFIDWIEGSWSNVVGLPVATVDRLLDERCGWRPIDRRVERGAILRLGRLPGRSL